MKHKTDVNKEADRNATMGMSKSKSIKPVSTSHNSVESLSRAKNNKTPIQKYEKDLPIKKDKQQEVIVDKSLTVTLDRRRQTNRD